jgi:hypothetical protein
MKVAVVGSRSVTDYALVRRNLDWLVEEWGPFAIITGGCRGADQLAERYARERDFPLQVFGADWKRFGKQAGWLRNLEMVKAADRVIAFWDGESRGTALTIEIADARNKLCHIVRVDGIASLQAGIADAHAGRLLTRKEMWGE